MNTQDYLAEPVEPLRLLSTISDDDDDDDDGTRLYLATSLSLQVKKKGTNPTNNVLFMNDGKGYAYIPPAQTVITKINDDLYKVAIKKVTLTFTYGITFTPEGTPITSLDKEKFYQYDFFPYYKENALTAKQPYLDENYKLQSVDNAKVHKYSQKEGEIDVYVANISGTFWFKKSSPTVKFGGGSGASMFALRL